MKKVLFPLIVALLAASSAGGLAQQEKDYRRAPYSRLTFTNETVDMRFYSYMSCRLSDNDGLGYPHARVKSGDRIVFENGDCLEIGETQYSFNGTASDYPDKKLQSCIIWPTNIVYGAFISPCATPWMKEQGGN